MTTYEFNTDGPVRFEVEINAGDIDISTHDAPRTELELTTTPDPALASEIEVNFDDHHGQPRVSVSVPRALERRVRNLEVTLTAAVPTGSTLRSRTASADLRTTGRLGAVDARSASGEVRIDSAEEVEISTASGDVSAGRVSGTTEIKTASGDIDAEQLASRASVSTASGDISIRRCAADLTVKAASGDVRLGDVASVQLKLASGDVSIDSVSADAEVHTVSGDITAGVPAGAAVWVDAHSLTGGLDSDISLDGNAPEGDDHAAAGRRVRIRANSVSGDIRIIRAGSAR